MNSKGTVIVLGGDGFCGWPTSLYLSRRGYRVVIVDNLVRRRMDEELGVSSLTPIASIEDRLKAWMEVSERENANWELDFVNIDLASDYDGFVSLLRKENPHTIFHFAEQRSAPYSMKDSKHKIYTVKNNLSTTTTVLCGIVDVNPSIHLIHLGTMGVYGYGSIPGMMIPEGYMNVLVKDDEDELRTLRIVHPANPGSIYHTTKTQDHLLFQFFNKNDNLLISDLHQGIVWGSITEETMLHPALINRFDWDSDFGTVLNRFIIQGAMSTPLTVYGTGEQTRAFIHIRDAMRCYELSLLNPPKKFDEVLVRNQVTETHQIKELAQLVSQLTNTDIRFIYNPRNEAVSNTLKVDNRHFLNLNLQPTFLKNGLVFEIIDIVKKYSYRINNQNAILPVSFWTNQRSVISNQIKNDDQHFGVQEQVPVMKIDMTLQQDVPTNVNK